MPKARRKLRKRKKTSRSSPRRSKAVLLLLLPLIGLAVWAVWFFTASQNHEKARAVLTTGWQQATSSWHRLQSAVASEPDPDAPPRSRATPPDASDPSPYALHPDRRATVPQSGRQPANLYEVQVALSAHAISCGSIDGVDGAQTRLAIRAFQEKMGLPVTGEIDEATRRALVVPEPFEVFHTITRDELEQLGPVAVTWLGKSFQTRLPYETALEFVAEKFRAHPDWIRARNPQIDWSAPAPGTVVMVPNAPYAPPRSKAAYLQIRLGERILRAYAPDESLLAHFPCSIAQRVEKRPLGTLYVETIAADPSYRFDPKIFSESPEAREIGRPLMIPPGPNNPVGTAWIGLNKPGYGIHGTPKPEDVGRTESRGCFRLANWNAEYLLQLVSPGIPVRIEP